MTDNADVNTPGPAYRAHEYEWNESLRLTGNSEEMRSAYLSQDPGESDEEYRLRKSGSFYTRHYDSFLRRTAGKILPKLPVISSDTPEWMEPLLANIDLQGTNLAVYLFGAVYAALRDGVYFTLVDYDDLTPYIADAQENGRPFTRADELKLSPRPYCVPIEALAMIDAQGAVTGSAEQAVSVRVRRKLARKTGRFTWEEFDSVWVYEMIDGFFHRQIFYDAGGSAGWIAEDEPKKTSLREIPIAAMYFNRDGFMTGAPPFMGVAEKGLQAFLNESRTDAAVRHAQSYLTAFFGFNIGRQESSPGANDGDPGDFGTYGSSGKVKVSGNKLLITGKAYGDARVETIARDPTPITVAMNRLEKIEAQLEAYGAMALGQRTGNAVATSRALDMAEADSLLRQFPIAVEQFAKQIVRLFFLWNGGGKVPDDQDFDLIGIERDKLLGAIVSDRDMDDLLKALEAGAISHETYLNEGVRREFFSDTLDTDEELARTAAEADADAERAAAARLDAADNLEDAEEDVPENAAEDAEGDFEV